MDAMERDGTLQCGSVAAAYERLPRRFDDGRLEIERRMDSAVGSFQTARSFCCTHLLRCFWTAAYVLRRGILVRHVWLKRDLSGTGRDGQCQTIATMSLRVGC